MLFILALGALLASCLHPPSPPARARPLCFRIFRLSDHWLYSVVLIYIVVSLLLSNSPRSDIYTFDKNLGHWSTLRFSPTIAQDLRCHYVYVL